MTVPNTNTQELYTGSPPTINWPYTFPIILGTDVVVSLIDPTGVETVLTSNYTVDTVNAQVIYPTVISGLAPLPASWHIRLKRVEPITQLLDLLNQGALNEENLETSLDKVTMICQQLNALIASINATTLPTYALGYLYCNGTALSWTAVTSTTYAGTIGRGIDTAKWASPVAGDIYIATDTAKLYICFVTNTWTFYVGGGAATRVYGTFNNASLTTGVLTITHSFALSAPYALSVSIFDNTGKQIVPDGITGAANTIAIDLSSYGVIAGVWGFQY